MKPSRGFSLVEIAVVLVIVAILVTAIGVPLATQLEQQRTVDTQKQLDTIKEALYGYAMANGRLPCPATLASNGSEAFASGGTAANGNCSTFSGYVPAATLGLSPVDSAGFFVDAFGLSQNRVRYAVRGLTITATTLCTSTPTNPLTATGTSTVGIKGATMACLADTSANNLLTVKSTVVSNTPSGCTSIDLSLKAPFVLFSLGKNAGSATSGIGSDETQNLTADGATNATFVSHTPTPLGNCAGEFDDIVTWGSLNTLFAKMVQAGKLP